MINAFLAIMETPGEVTGPINIGNPGEFTIRSLAEMVVELTGSKSRIEFRPLPSDDPRQRQPDITLARETLGWEPRTALKDGLLKTIAYFEETL
jgi:UDP-glucuronate decarboxylase